MKYCTKCGKEIPDNKSVCKECDPSVSKQKNTQKKEIPSTYGFIVAAIAVIGIFLMIKTSAILGFIIYGICFFLALDELKKDDGFFKKGEHVEYAKDCFSKENRKLKGPLYIIYISLPLVILLALYSFIVLDSIRTSTFIYDKVYDHIINH